MPIELFTGLPGNGKTAFMVERLMEEAKKAERPLVACGIDGLQPGLALELDDPRDWNKVNSEGEHIVPDGALIFVDEAWKWFGHLHDAGRQATPQHVLQLAEHRHRGLDFVWTTQMPAQLYPFARSLIARHTHVVRRFGTKFVDLYTWEELNDDVKSVGKRENAQKQVRTLPDQVFGAYKSASLHTIKRRLPFKLFVLPAAVVAAVALLWTGVNYFRPSNLTDRLGGEGTDAALAAAAPLSIEPAAKEERRELDVVEYVERQQPRIATAPWSAPLYDDRTVTVDPQLFCMSAKPGEGRGQECTCLTEQGTRYVVRDDMCEDQARHGPSYNPFRAVQERPEYAAVESQRADVQLLDGPAAAVGIGEAGYPARYGQFRNEPQGPREYRSSGW
ncbi:MAG: hypothetical protein GX772_10255 [Alcaligenaceae bacterium]|nr:hypothetical protein [Alcaligenaceae bacterium]